MAGANSRRPSAVSGAAASDSDNQPRVRLQAAHTG